MQTSGYLDRPKRSIEQVVKDVLPVAQKDLFFRLLAAGKHDKISALTIARGNPVQRGPLRRFGEPFVTYETKKRFGHG